LNTAVLFAFSIVYFSILTDVGVFDLMVKKVMRFMGNKVELALLLATIICTVTMISGSGANTMLVTIPTMLPIFKKMKIRPVALLLLASLSSGIMNMFPWCPSVLRIASATKLDPYLVWKTALPVQIIGIILTFLLIFVIGRVERHHGAGMTDEEFAQMKLEIAQPA
jgi:CitMHS family citrate-Mg2+:H+ or citrate-Ca2+:H+ symporter